MRDTGMHVHDTASATNDVLQSVSWVKGLHGAVSNYFSYGKAEGAPGLLGSGSYKPVYDTSLNLALGKKGDRYAICLCNLPCAYMTSCFCRVPGKDPQANTASDTFSYEQYTDMNETLMNDICDEKDRPKSFVARICK